MNIATPDIYLLDTLFFFQMPWDSKTKKNKKIWYNTGLESSTVTV